MTLDVEMVLVLALCLGLAYLNRRKFRKTVWEPEPIRPQECRYEDGPRTIVATAFEYFEAHKESLRNSACRKCNHPIEYIEDIFRGRSYRCRCPGFYILTWDAKEGAQGCAKDFT